MVKNRGKWLLSLFLSADLALGLAVTPALAVPTGEVSDQATAAQSVEDYISAAAKADAEAGYGTTTGTGVQTFSLKTDDLDISTGTVATSLVTESGAEPDLSDPAVSAVSDELDSMQVLAEEGSDQKVALTDEQKQTVLALYQQYQDQWKANADVLGVQVPFYLQFNDNNEDGLGVLGEMLVLASVSVDDVRNGNYTYDNLTGMIMNFLYGDKLGVEYYGDQIRSQRDAALKAVEDSGAKTEYQKLLVLNDWLATQDTFDMSYIMNSMDSNNPAMVAADPQPAKDYQRVHDAMYDVYKDQLTTQFHDQIYAGVKQNFLNQYWQGAFKQTAYSASLAQQGVTDESQATDAQKDTANKAAEAFLSDNADAITSDPKGLATEKFGADTAEQLQKGADDFIASAEKDGVEVAEGVKMTLEQLTQQSMANDKILDLDGDGTNDTTANDAVPVYAEQAAQGMTTGILGYWEGNHVGALCLGTSVCKGYAAAYQYLVQCMHPEVYLKDGATDYKVASNWKEAKDLYYNDKGELDPSQNYLVDTVRITFQADVKMYGEEQPDFNSDHFWNAVKVDGQWYYVDPCYTDVYSEVMMRDRVETDGYMNHLYFMFSDTTARNLYKDNFKEIKGLYQGVATDTKYEDSWFSRAKTNVYFNGSDTAYYVYDSTDLISMLDKYNSGNQSDWSDLQKPARYKLVAHSIANSDDGDGDTDYTTLIEFNKSDDDNDALGKAYVRVNGEMVENDMLTKLYAEHAQMADTYPSIAITTALYNGKLYFNLSKYLLSYDLSTGDVQVVKSYDTVNMVRDDTKAFGGMAFSLTDDASNADFTFKNHPIAGICLKGDNLTVSIATNLAYISGKDDVTNRNNPQADENGKKDPSYTVDSKANGYGYEFEETNYNPNYSSYSKDQGSQYGYKSEINDNDEFMFVANGVTTVPMSSVASGTAEYVEDTHEHHYVESDETYFTKDDNGSWETGKGYVCTECGKGVTEPIDNSGSMGGMGGTDDDYEERKAEYDAAAENAAEGHKYESDAVWSTDNNENNIVTYTYVKCSTCDDVKDQLDLLVNNNTVEVKYDTPQTVYAELTTPSATPCPEDVENDKNATYTAKIPVGDATYEMTRVYSNVNIDHVWRYKFDWSEDFSAATVQKECAICATKDGDPVTAEVKAEVTKEPTCSEEGSKSYTATAVVDGETRTEVRTVILPKVDHNYAEPAADAWKWSEDGKSATVTLTCNAGGETKDFTAEVAKDEDKSTAATCDKEGADVYVATVKTDNGQTFTAEHSVATPKVAHEYEAAFTWADDGSSATAKLTCKNCGDVVDNLTAEVKKNEDESVAPTCGADGKNVFDATVTHEGKTYTDTHEVVVPATGEHKFDYVFDWAEDGSSATVTYKCSVCGYGEGASPLTATVTEKTDARVEPTCSKDGSKTMVATVTLQDGTAKTEEKQFAIPATGEHNYADPAESDWKWAEDGTSATVTLKCTNGGETADFEAVIKKDTDKSVEPTYETEGTYVYVATVTTDNGQTFKSSKTVTVPKVDIETMTMYRLYNKYTGEHFYTGSIVERDSLVEAGWTSEGTGWIAPRESSTPVYRLYNPNVEGGDHHYTTSTVERDSLVKAGWKLDKGEGKDGAVFYSDDAKTVPVYREYNPNAYSCNHNYTASEVEHNSLIDAGWNDEGIGWYAVRIN